GREDFAAVARDTLDWAARDMTSPDGGFYTAVDADSAGEEGRFYLWTPDEIAAVLDPAAATIATTAFGVTSEGQVDGRSVLHVAEPLSAIAERQGLAVEAAQTLLDSARSRLLAARGTRPQPATDRKVVIAWNGLMISAFARAGQALHEPAYTERARRAADAVLAHTSGGGL